MPCWPRLLFVAVVSVIAAGQMVTACGQKGDLYLPEEAPGAERSGAPGPVEQDVADDLPPGPGPVRADTPPTAPAD